MVRLGVPLSPVKQGLATSVIMLAVALRDVVGWVLFAASGGESQDAAPQDKIVLPTMILASIKATSRVPMKASAVLEETLASAMQIITHDARRWEPRPYLTVPPHAPQPARPPQLPLFLLQYRPLLS